MVYCFKNQVIASMTVGKDVSALFPDVVNCMQTDNLELKKLVYLYLMNYAKSQPDMAIMAVNTFVKVCVIQEILLRFRCLPFFFFYIFRFTQQFTLIAIQYFFLCLSFFLFSKQELILSVFILQYYPKRK